MIGAIRDVIRALPGPDSGRSILVLGDPTVTMCGALAADGHHVSCCSDLQVARAAPPHAAPGTLTIETLMAGDGYWDAVIAVDGFERIEQAHPPEVRARLLRWLANHAVILVMHPPRNTLAPDLHDFGPYRMTEITREFRYVTELDPRAMAGQSSAAVVASNVGLLLDDRWIEDERLTPLSRNHSGVSEAVRTYGLADEIIKLECASEHYFERCQALQEAGFLQAASDDLRQDLDLPNVRIARRGRAASILVRDRVPGVPLVPGACAAGTPHIAAVVRACASYAAAALFHNDLRPWNLLQHDGRVRLVDWADVGPRDLDTQGLPQVVAFAGTLAAVLDDRVPWGDSFVGAVKDSLTGSGLLAQWPWHSLLDDPWLTLPTVADDLSQALIDGPSDADSVMATTLTAIMTAAGALR